MLILKLLQKRLHAGLKKLLKKLQNQAKTLILRTGIFMNQLD